MRKEGILHLLRKSKNIRLQKSKQLARTNLQIAPSKLLILINIKMLQHCGATTYNLCRKGILFDCKIFSIIAVSFTTAGVTQIYYDPILGPHLEKVSSLL